MTLHKTNIRADKCFKKFIVGESNEKAYKAAFNFPSIKSDWLWLYSGSGLGNTHLLHAIGNKLLEQEPDLKIKQIHIETLCRELRQSQIKVK